MDLFEMEMFKEVWPSSYDDSEIDEIIWSEIESSPSRGDFFCYLIHRPQKARYEKEARARVNTMDESNNTAPVGYARAVERIRALAAAGDAKAMFHMGKLYVHGIGVKQDLKVAETWYNKAIQAGEMRAHCNMGWLYLYGFGTILPNKGRAFWLLSIGAESGIPAARASIGMMLLTGDGIPANPKFGLRMLQVAFNLGYDNAGNHLSDLYFAGKFVPKDIDLAHDWLFKVAERGDARTMAILGHYLVTGSHGKTDVGQGIKLLQDAVAKEYVFAYFWLGNLYRNGNGVDRDMAKAREWFEKGAAAGNEGCTLALTTLLLQTKPSSGPSPLP